MLCEDRKSLLYIFCLLLLKFSLYLGFQEYASLVSLFLCLEFAELLESAELCLSQIWKIFSCFFRKLLFLIILLVLSLVPQLPMCWYCPTGPWGSVHFFQVYSLLFRMSYFCWYIFIFIDFFHYHIHYAFKPIEWFFLINCNFSFRISIWYLSIDSFPLLWFPVFLFMRSMFSFISLRVVIMTALKSLMLILTSTLIAFPLKVDHIFHFLCMSSNFELCLGHREYYVVDTLDSVIFLQRVLIFLF